MIFKNMTPKTVNNKKVGKLDLIKIKNFCVSKDTINRMKRKSTNERKHI